MPGLYHDNQNRSRYCEITIDAVERILSRTGVDLYAPEDLDRLQNDTMQTLRVVHALQGRSESFEEFWTAHQGGPTEQALAAFWEALIDFYPKSESSAGPAPDSSELRRGIWKMAGFIGINPGPLTLRQLFWMIEGRCPEIGKTDTGGEDSLRDLARMIGAKGAEKTVRP
jgi:hypothetical protein